VGYEAEDVPAVQPMEFEQDALHANNPQYCVDYVHEIFEHLIATENKLMPSSAYMDTVLSVLPHHLPPPSPAHMNTKCSIFQIVTHSARGCRRTSWVSPSPRISNFQENITIVHP